MTENIARLILTLDKLARTTWMDIADGRRLGVGMGEVGITDRNMLALRREHPSVLIRKHTGPEEVQTGADWEWWLHISDGWICLVFQAKLLNIDGRYAGITKGQAEGKSQVDLLLRSCLMRSERLHGAVWPLYCFYNSWRGGWPEDVPRQDGTSIPAEEELQLYGCAVANAWNVRQILASRYYSNRRTLRDSYLPLSRPWSKIFPQPADSAPHNQRQIATRLSSWMPDGRQLPPAPRDDAVGSDFGKLRPRNRLRVYHDPAPISRPPEYVLDLLEHSRTRPRRLKPLARRVVILSELA
jgi:hypothetical protein